MHDILRSTDASIETGEWFFENCGRCLRAALFDRELLRARAAEANLRRALRHADGRDAATCAIDQAQGLVKSLLPRLWALGQASRSDITS